MCGELGSFGICQVREPFGNFYVNVIAGIAEGVIGGKRNSTHVGDEKKRYQAELRAVDVGCADAAGDRKWIAVDAERLCNRDAIGPSDWKVRRGRNPTREGAIATVAGYLDHNSRSLNWGKHECQRQNDKYPHSFPPLSREPVLQWITYILS